MSKDSNTPADLRALFANAEQDDRDSALRRIGKIPEGMNRPSDADIESAKWQLSRSGGVLDMMGAIMVMIEEGRVALTRYTDKPGGEAKGWGLVVVGEPDENGGQKITMLATLSMASDNRRPYVEPGVSAPVLAPCPQIGTLIHRLGERTGDNQPPGMTLN